MELHPAVYKPSDVPIYAKAYPDATTTEWCPYCERESVIKAYSVGVCEHCGERIVPCSMCEECLPHCPYV